MQIIPVPPSEGNIRDSLSVTLDPENLILSRDLIGVDAFLLEGNLILLVVVRRRRFLHVAQKEGDCVSWKVRSSMSEAETVSRVSWLISQMGKKYRRKSWWSKVFLRAGST